MSTWAHNNKEYAGENRQVAAPTDFLRMDEPIMEFMERVRCRSEKRLSGMEDLSDRLIRSDIPPVKSTRASLMWPPWIFS